MEGPRPLKPAELTSLVGLCNRVFRAKGGDMGREFAYYLNRENAGRLRVFVEGGEVVSHCGYQKSDALVFGARTTVGCIGAVCTRPDMQGKGLGTRLLQDCLAAMRSEGIDFAMISGGRGLYTRNNAVSAGRAREFRFHADRAACWCSDVQVTQAVPGDAEGLAALYRQEPVRFTRTQGDWTDIVAGRWCMNRPARIYSIRRSDALVAYAAIRTPGAKDKPGTVMLIGEYAGCRRSFVEALPAMSAASGLAELDVHVASWDSALAAELSSRGLEAKVVPAIGGTVKLVNLPQLLERAAGLAVERAGARAATLVARELTENRMALGLDAGRLELSETDACRVVFGAPDNSDKTLLEGRGELGRMLGTMLPLELPWYGFNYI